MTELDETSAVVTPGHRRTTGLPWRVLVRSRDPHEAERAASPLELFFDLVFVVAIASAGTQWHHSLSEGHLADVVGYLMAFCAIWWCWVNYTWYASAYDNGDVVFRLLSFVVMSGALVMAAGIPQFAAAGKSVVVVVGYAIMRLGMIPMWLRAARDNPVQRRTALTYAVGIAIVQVLWALGLLVDGHGWLILAWLVGMSAELSIPAIAEHAGRSPYHAGHIAERYASMTIIVLGEVVLAGVVVVQSVLGAEGATFSADLALLIVGALLIVFALWWIYFSRDQSDLVERQRMVFGFAYLHLPVFIGVAATGAAIAAAVDVAHHDAHAASRTVALALAAGIAIYVVSLSTLHAVQDGSVRVLVPAVITGLAILVVAALGLPIGITVLIIGVILGVAIAQYVIADNRSARPRLGSVG